MDRSIYEHMALHDRTHWWYRGRREILQSVIARRIRPGTDARILEIGCGTGHNLGMLEQFGKVDAIEIDPASRAIATERLGRQVFDAQLPALDGLPAGKYDLVALLDVLEHVGDDVAALRTIGSRLAKGATLVLTVPQHRWLWSGHDVANHHHRRYSKHSLRQAIADAGLKLMLMQSFNSLLFPLAAADRVVARITGREGSEDTPPPEPFNTLMEKIFALERYAVGRMPMPSGVSLIALVSAR